MMKRLMMIAVFAISTVGMAAQGEKGHFSLKPMMGLNVTTLHCDVSSADIYKAKARFAAGVEAEYSFNNWMGLSLGAIYSQQGAAMEGVIPLIMTDNEGNTHPVAGTVNMKVHCDYLNFPLMANFYIPKLKGLAIKAGIQVGVLVHSGMKGSMRIDVIPSLNNAGLITADGSMVRTAMTSGAWTGICNSVDVGIPLGLSYEYKNFVVDARYCFGLTNIDNSDDLEKSYNRCFTLTLGYRFGL